MPRGRPKATGTEAQEILDRRMKVLALRRDGHTMAAVATALDITLSKVTTDVKWLRGQGYDLGEGHTGRQLPPPGPDMSQLRVVAAADDEATVRREVNDRRIRGEDILSIAIAMQIIPQEVRRHIHDAARIAQEGDVEARRELELARLDRMLVYLDEGMRYGDPKAINAARSVVAERCKIGGLYRPIQVEHTVITMDMIDAEMARLHAELQELQGGVVEGEIVRELPAGPRG